MQRMKEGKCKHFGEKWYSKHKFSKGKETKNLYTCEAINGLDSEESNIE